MRRLTILAALMLAGLAGLTWLALHVADAYREQNIVTPGPLK